MNRMQKWAALYPGMVVLLFMEVLSGGQVLSHADEADYEHHDG